MIQLSSCDLMRGCVPENCWVIIRSTGYDDSPSMQRYIYASQIPNGFLPYNSRTKFLFLPCLNRSTPLHRLRIASDNNRFTNLSSFGFKSLVHVGLYRHEFDTSASDWGNFLRTQLPPQTRGRAHNFVVKAQYDVYMAKPEKAPKQHAKS